MLYQKKKSYFIIKVKNKNKMIIVLVKIINKKFNKINKIKKMKF